VVPDDFVVHLTPDRVAAHIEQRRNAVRRWAQSEQAFVQRFYKERIKWMASRRN
jgi:hypothetical protein